MNRRLRMDKAEDQKRFVRLKKELIDFLWNGHYNLSSTITNKILYYLSKRYVIPSYGVIESARISMFMRSNLDYENFLEKLDDIFLEIIHKYKESESLELIGWISYLTPYKIHDMIEELEMKSSVTIETYPTHIFDGIADTRNYEEVPDIMEYLEADNIIDYLELETKLSDRNARELADRFLLNHASVRRILSEKDKKDKK